MRNLLDGCVSGVRGYEGLPRRGRQQELSTPGGMYIPGLALTTHPMHGGKRALTRKRVRACACVCWHRAARPPCIPTLVRWPISRSSSSLRGASTKVASAPASAYRLARAMACVQQGRAGPRMPSPCHGGLLGCLINACGRATRSGVGIGLRASPTLLRHRSRRRRAALRSPLGGGLASRPVLMKTHPRAPWPTAINTDRAVQTNA